MTKRMPVGLEKRGKALWKSIFDAYEISEAEASILEQACRTRDVIDALQEQVASDGMMIASSQGSRLHPGIVEARQQRLALARLLATLGAQAPDDDDDLPRSTGARGVYAGSMR